MREHPHPPVGELVQAVASRGENRKTLKNRRRKVEWGGVDVRYSLTDQPVTPAPCVPVCVHVCTSTSGAQRGLLGRLCAACRMLGLRRAKENVSVDVANPCMSRIGLASPRLSLQQDD